MNITANAASLYDLRCRAIQSDLEAIRRLTRGAGRVLEVGSGTGRVLRALAVADVLHVTGIERDEQKWTFSAEALREYKNVEPIFGDFLDYETDARFDRILFAFNVLFEFAKMEDRLAALRKAHTLLKSGGRIVTMNALQDFASWSDLQAEYVFQIADEDLGAWDCSITCARDPVRQISRCRVVYRKTDGTHPDVEDAYCSALVTRNELLALHQAAGLRVVEEYGSLDLSPLTANTEDLIHVLETA